MRLMYRYIMGLVMSLSVPALFGQFRADMQLNKDSMLIGEVLEVRIEVDWPYSSSFASVVPSDTSWIVLSSTTDTVLWKKDNKFIQDLRLTRFDSGYHILSFRPLVLNKDSLRVSASYVLVDLPVARETELEDIVDPLEAPFNWPLYVALPLAILLTLFLIYWIVKKIRDKPSSIGPRKKEKKDPRLVAIQMLDALVEKKAWEMELRNYYTTVTNVLRIYLEEQYSVSALEMTGNEIARILPQVNMDEEMRKKLRAFLVASDFAKYAEKADTGRDLKGEIDLLRNFVERYPAVEAPTEEPENNNDQV
jgi:hypothetical protein